MLHLLAIACPLELGPIDLLAFEKGMFGRFPAVDHKKTLEKFVVLIDFFYNSYQEYHSFFAKHLFVFA